AVTLFGIAYLPVPNLYKGMIKRNVYLSAIGAITLWTVGMLFMSGAVHTGGFFGVDRRTGLSDYFGSEQAASWNPYLIILAVGAVLLMVSVVMVLHIVFHLMWKAPKGQTEFPIAEVEDDAAPTPKWTERWSLWIVLMIAIVSM